LEYTFNVIITLPLMQGMGQPSRDALSAAMTQKLKVKRCHTAKSVGGVLAYLPVIGL